MNTVRNIPSTNYKTTLDGVFSRFLNVRKSEIYVSYFSYHKPIVTCIRDIEEIKILKRTRSCMIIVTLLYKFPLKP
ncbi:Uncharacterized protein FWK35_00030554 [Aphis craccivora]|uniref:Uncharacterized protein n=1 Tax=Aphis craccivora TaxID=307492 RepID=A0A6G0VTJ5_APHCR|nr:Uncharacterized protein FWK35_00030554 [Aphis craccivora]